MTEKDFSTIKKTLHIIQKVQATTKVYAFWINYNKYDDGSVSVCVTLFMVENGTPTSFDFYSFQDAEERLEKYNEMMDYINK